jgi:nucleoside-diphosphate kinase
MTEQSLVLVKPDGVQKQLVGEIIKRIEQEDLKICAMKMVWPDEKLAKKHYPLDETWAKEAFEKTIKNAKAENREVNFEDHMDFAETLQSWLVDSITESPVVAMAIKGNQAIKKIREIVGPTEPAQAPTGTIRGDFAPEESYKTANDTGRALRNLVHASDSVENAKKELDLWFEDHEIHNH